MNKAQLVKRVKETSYLEGDFVLRSGKRSKYYMDKYLFETQPDVLRALGKAFSSHLTPDVTLIAGAELGGVALAAATAMESAKPWIIVRNSKKDYGTSKMVEVCSSPAMWCCWSRISPPPPTGARSGQNHHRRGSDRQKNRCRHRPQTRRPRKYRAGRLRFRQPHDKGRPRHYRLNTGL